MNQTVVENKELLDVEWVALIMLARKMGLSVEEIRTTLNDLKHTSGQAAILDGEAV